MAKTDKPAKLPVYNTPAGRAVYPWLNKPDTRFDPDGVYQVKLVLTAKEAAPLIEIIEEQLKEAKAEAEEKYEALTPAKKKKAEIEEADSQFEDELDDDGEETGNVVFKFKSKASGQTKEGKQWNRKVPLFDAKGEPSKASIYGGSTLICAFAAKPWANAKLAYGVKLQLEGVQIIDLVTGGGGRSASALGFAAQEGYEASDEEEEAAEDDAADEGTTDGSADF